jgi:hypothetical protein
LPVQERQCGVLGQGPPPALLAKQECCQVGETRLWTETCREVARLAGADPARGLRIGARPVEPRPRQALPRPRDHLCGLHQPITPAILGGELLVDCEKPMISAVIDLPRIELNRLAWRHELKSVDSPPTMERFVSVSDQPPLETGHACQDFSMQNYIESQNIANFRERLRMEADPNKQKILLRLLADEIAKYAARIKASVLTRS